MSEQKTNADQAATIRKLEKEVAELKAQLEQARDNPLSAEPLEVQEMVREKVAAGLDYYDALSVARRQWKHDSELAKAAA